MAPSSFDPALDQIRPIGVLSPPDEARYPAHRRKLMRLALAGLVAEGYLGHALAGQVQEWIEGSVTPEIQLLVATVVAAILAVYILLWLWGALVARPDLTATSDGIVLRTFFGSYRIPWTSLSPFALRSFVLPTGRQVFRASAQIVGPDATGLPFRRRTITLVDAFTRPLPALVDALNSRRGRSLLAGGFHAQAAEQPAEEILGLAAFGQPYLSYTILGVLLAVSFIEQKFAVDAAPMFAPSYATLMAMGALAPLRVVYDGEWYRLFTAPLLHESRDHIIGNCIALLWGGRVLERLVGRVWYLAILLGGALGGSLGSMALQSANHISVGASGALMAMFAAILVIGFREPRTSRLRHSLHVLALWMMIPALLPYFLGRVGDHVAYAAHLGGALAGTAMGLILLDLWPHGERIPLRRGAAATICVVGMALLVASVVLAAIHYQTFDITVIPVE